MIPSGTILIDKKYHYRVSHFDTRMEGYWAQNLITHRKCVLTKWKINERYQQVPSSKLINILFGVENEF